ncbi:MAG: F0F1 ATP synthase subunit epsilon [Hyphomicrobiaceae bacterium TMED74]|nr:F0F1 ATP synthase subunit epsilon [Filomicrobium sp.]RPG41687.1 MAG: F0F1 ATP synthase subunit epsilon [Hyphomicrobiaceae bacterium TMED74]
MAEFSFELVSPERVLMSESVEHVVLPGSEGLLGVLSGHSPAVVTLKPGVISVLSGSTVKRKIYVRGGFAEINPETVTVLAEHAVDTEAADKDAISSELSVAEEDLADASDDDARYIAQSAIDALKSL